MSSIPSKAFRIKAAVVLVVTYAVCILTSPAAFAFSPNPHMAHCLTEGIAVAAVHDGDGAVQLQTSHMHALHLENSHVHMGRPTHHHHDNPAADETNDENGQAPDCCGLFSVLAISADVGFALQFLDRASPMVPAFDGGLDGRGPELINRPPIA